MKRLVALLVAVGLVGGAWYLRTNVIDDDGGGGSATPSGDAPTLICATEVAAACNRLDGVEVTVENPGKTLDRIASGEPLGADGWLVSQPWPDMATALQHPLADSSGVLARTLLDVVTTKRRPTNLECAPMTWTCVAAFAAVSSGFAHSGTDTTSGLLAIHGLATGILGTADYISNDFDDTDDFRARFAAIEGAVADNPRGAAGDLVEAIQTIQGAYTAVAVLGTTAEIARKNFEAVTPDPEITADVVLAGHPDRFDTEDISDALFTTGWLRSGDKSLSDTNGLPKPGVMVALRALSK